MLLKLTYELLMRDIRQNRMAKALGWDESKLSKIINGFITAKPAERTAIAAYLSASEDELFSPIAAAPESESVSPSRLS